MKTLFVVSTIAMLGSSILAACSPGHIAANKNGKAEYVYVGCHVVTESPSKDGSYAFKPSGDLKKGDRFYFKQKSNNGTVGSVVTGKPCE